MSFAVSQETLGARLRTDESACAIRTVLALMVALLLAGKVMFNAGAVLQDPDNWWHVKVGLDILAAGALPTVDTYTHTFAGEPWFAKEWLGQVLLAYAHLAAGWNAVAALTLAMVALSGFLLTFYLGRVLRPLAAAGLALAMVFLIAPTFNARPFIFTYPILIVWAGELFAAAEEERAPPLWLLGLIVLWANLHATFTLGFAVAFFVWLYLVDKTRLSRPRLHGRWIAFGFSCLLASLINPHGLAPLLSSIVMAGGNESIPFISEWNAFDAGKEPYHAAALLIGLFALLVSGLRIGWAKALFIVFTLHLFLVHTRFMYLFFLLVPLVLATPVAAQFPRLSAARWAAEARDGLERLIAARARMVRAGVALFVLACIALVASGPVIEPHARNSAGGAIEFARAEGITETGNVLNSYNFGGTLIFHGIPTFIDGRTDQLFLDGFMERDMEGTTTAGRPVLEAQIAEHEITWALLTISDRRIPFFETMDGWSEAYRDDGAVIFLRD